MATRALHLRDAQRQTLRTVLDSASPASTESTPWRVLILDDAAKTIVDTVLTTGDLRKHNVTLTQLLNTDRASLPTVPAVYIVAPTPENIARILRDVDGHGSGRRAIQRLYPHATVAFTTPCPQPLLAALATQCKLPSRITRVHDAYADFIALERDAFELRTKNSYADLHSPDAALRTAAVDSIVSGLFCVLASLRIVPIIRAQRFGPAEEVAQKLNARFREFLDDFGRPASFKRPILLLLDRDIDLTPALHHTWTYQALVQDCLRYQRNSVTLSIKSGNSAESKTVQKKYRLDKDTDSFWAEQAHKPFPAVAEAIEAALAQYRADVDAINRKASARANGTNDDDGDENKTPVGGLASAISSLPELSRRKEALDIHTNIGSALIEHIEKRKLDAFFEFETAVLEAHSSQRITQSHAAAHLSQLGELLRSAEGEAAAGTREDRARAACLFYATFGHVMDAEDASELKTIVEDADVDVSVLTLVRRVCGFDHDKVKPVEETVSKETTWTRPSFRGMMSSVVKKGYHGIAAFAQSAKTLMSERGTSFKTARTLSLFLSEEVREEEDDEVLDGFLYLDPKMDEDEGGEENVRAARRRKRRMVYEDSVVFVCGGGNYIEKTACAEVCAEGGRVLYGCTEMCGGDEFIRQMYAVAVNFN